MPRANNHAAVSRRALQSPISTIRPASASLKPRIAKKLALFHFLASFPRKSNNTHISRLAHLALFTKTKAFFSTFPPPSPKPASLQGIPSSPCSSLRPFPCAPSTQRTLGIHQKRSKRSPLNGPPSLPKIEAFRSTWNAEP
jgi:hypothetical protein